MNKVGNTFDYLLEKVSKAEMSDVPFPHIEITDFLAKEHFEEIVRERQIAIDSVSDTDNLLDTLEANGYQIINIAGGITSKRQYLDWLQGFKDESVHAEAATLQVGITTEGFGVVCRLTRYDSSILKELTDFFMSDRLKNLLVDKFGIESEVHVDAGIQKYLHGYEISPHPDTRNKALTWMLNINPSDESESMNFHTQYMKLKDQWRFISEFWRYNQDVDRCWLPWDWCETIKQQTRNNSIVLFRPSDDTIHAVKANYDHLKSQRTLAYGNLWYGFSDLKQIEFTAFDLTAGAVSSRSIAEQRSMASRSRVQSRQ